ncbi:matrixin family metalloprotease [Lacticaseibacillus paracasei]|uniref:matrixin family metalloprotease n=1 Tax=Lacticaseibacillus paracasei TaxID=1597 RepID=UPI00131FE68F|nr:matrixin family metalloprotease [Lacticaseibacillus paracasei]QHC81226.1 matrixin family metalloprotease [Lacticaseibacillus paracasei]
MKHRNRLFWLIMLVAGIFLIYSTESPVPIAARNTVKQGISNVWTATTDTVSTWLNGGPRSVAKNGASIASTAPSQASQVPSATPSQAVDATPALSIVQRHQLRSVYYYLFDDNLPQSEHDVFLKAVKAYNATGIVKLVAGQGKKSDNQITFSSYKKEMSAESFGSTELGAGGPTIIVETYGSQVTVINHARASLNLSYPLQSVNDAVAMHELGHALGLDHSQSKASVMYPITQGVSQLSAGDIAGLKAIYGSR